MQMCKMIKNAHFNPGKRLHKLLNKQSQTKRQKISYACKISCVVPSEP